MAEAGAGKGALVTGGAGFVGSHLCEPLLNGGHRVVCKYNRVTGDRENAAHLEGLDFEFVEHDVTTYIAPLGTSMGSSTSPPRRALRVSERTPILEVGALGAYNALGLAKAREARLMLASTSEAYGDALVHP